MRFGKELTMGFFLLVILGIPLLIDALIRNKERVITELDSYKKSLIYEYVTGKKEVPA
jgi:putative Mn2+ efflux pump MntP